MVYKASVLALVLFAMVRTGASRCNREPEGHSSPRAQAGNRYRLQISGNEDTYTPGETYRVTLIGARTDRNTQTFTGFTIAVESETFWGDDSTARVGNISTLGDALTMYGLRCPNTVVQTSSVPKSEVQVLWRAPESGSGCVLFRATVIEQPNVWYMDDGRLTLRLCESQQTNHDKQPDIFDPCCACDEAKYEMTFEGMWSRYTHPKDFPENSWVTRFSDVIGASHTAQYNFWTYGGYASEGLRQVAERGTTRALESELKAKSQHIRTIIKARGIGFPNVTGKTFAVFRVDRKHHLMSIVSMIDPSPDWIVGVSALELCLKNCSWVESITLNLYPWDVGTDSGITYMSEDSPNPTPEPIRRITSTWPDDERSPFYDPHGEDIKPLARIQLTRQRLYEKSCEGVVDQNPDSPTDSECATTSWQEYGECIPSCGMGWRRAQREYVDPDLAYIHGCQVQLTRRERCENEPCTNIGISKPGAQHNPQCDVTEWGDWSECSSPCGGTMMRERSYINPRAHKFCNSFYDAPALQEVMQCDPDPDAVDCDTEHIPRHCQLTPWSDWSTCSATCGNGTRIRTRKLMSVNSEAQMIDSMEDNQDMSDDFNREELSDPGDCSNVVYREEMRCTGMVERCIIDSGEVNEVCQLPPKEGPCRMQSVRWYFDPETESCQKFNFGGCRGNENNFGSQQECEEVCQGVREDTTPAISTTEDPLKGLSVMNRKSSPDSNYYSVSTTTPMQEITIKYVDERHRERVNCKLTHWSEWSPCSATCGRSIKTRTREIKVHPRNGGKPCNKRLRRTRLCPVPPCEIPEELQSDESPEGENDPFLPGVDCELSEWSPWSPCSMSCGNNAVKQRTRSIKVEPTAGGMPCGRRIEVTYCSLPRCKD
ncbi:spondin-1 isoform X2 [Anabrus simplex]|uniref:spondin-1 isoform X2 n=1 Tax=Anabrus simplex TaxID=316456 RepID=UPI0035A286E7